MALPAERMLTDAISEWPLSPTEARDIANVVHVVATSCRRPWFAGWCTYFISLVPLTGADTVSAERLSRFCGARRRVYGDRQGDYPTPTMRLNSRLECRCIRGVFGLDQPDWRELLTPVIRDLDGAAS